MKKQFITGILSLMIMGSIWIPAEMVANAEEISVP